MNRLARDNGRWILHGGRGCTSKYYTQGFSLTYFMSIEPSDTSPANLRALMSAFPFFQSSKWLQTFERRFCKRQFTESSDFRSSFFVIRAILITRIILPTSTSKAADSRDAALPIPRLPPPILLHPPLPPKGRPHHLNNPPNSPNRRKHHRLPRHMSGPTLGHQTLQPKRQM